MAARRGGQVLRKQPSWPRTRTRTVRHTGTEAGGGKAAGAHHPRLSVEHALVLLHPARSERRCSSTKSNACIYTRAHASTVHADSGRLCARVQGRAHASNRLRCAPAARGEVRAQNVD